MKLFKPTLQYLSALIVAILLFVPAFVNAQTNGMDQFDYQVSSLKVLQDRSVQDEIGITDAQRTKMNQFAHAYDAQLAAYKASKKKQNQVFVVDQTVADMFDKVKAKVLAVLTPVQLRRLREISLQAFGLNGILDPLIAKKVGLSEDQMNRMNQTYKAGSKEVNDIVQQAVQTNTPKAQYFPKLKKINDSTQAQMIAIFTPQQKKAFLDLQGKTFHEKQAATPAKTGKKRRKS